MDDLPGNHQDPPKLSLGQKLRLIALSLITAAGLAASTCMAIVIGELPFVARSTSTEQVIIFGFFLPVLGVGLWIYLTVCVVRALLFEARHRAREAKDKKAPTDPA